jgi:hypothetical protein
VAAGLCWSWLSFAGNGSPRRAASYALGVALAGIIAWWRAVALEGGPMKGYHAWYIVLVVLLLTIAGVVVWLRGGQFDRQERRILIAASVLAVVPAVYAFGTNVVLVLFAAGAGIFWAASLLLIIGLAPPLRRDEALKGGAFLCAVVTGGMLIGTVITPGHTGESLWLQTEIVELGPQRARLALEPPRAAHLRALQRAAYEHGFQIGTPVVDLSAVGPGVTFALGGEALGAAWLHVHFSRGEALPQAILSRVARGRLQNAWLVTGADFDLARTIVKSQGLDLPADYEQVAADGADPAAGTQTLWKPRMPAAR